MRLSRVSTHKSKKKPATLFPIIKNDAHHLYKKIIITSIITGTALFSTSYAFADGGLTEYLKRWYSERVSEVEVHLTTSIEAEATNQKALLLKEVREQTELSIQEIQDYAASKQTTIMSNIVNKANETKEAIASDIQADIDLTKKLIDEQATVIPPTGEASNTTEKTPIQQELETPAQPNDEKDRNNVEKDKQKSNPIVIEPVENSK
jgi:ribosomal protein L7/L12